VHTNATNWTETTRVTFRTTNAAQSISEAIATCPGMHVIFDRNAGAVISMYEVTADQGTYAEISALTATATFSSDTSLPYSFMSGKPFLRFVVDSPETGSGSVIELRCSKSMGNGGFATSAAIPSPIDCTFPATFHCTF